MRTCNDDKPTPLKAMLRQTGKAQAVIWSGLPKSRALEYCVDLLISYGIRAGAEEIKAVESHFTEIVTGLSRVARF